MSDLLVGEIFCGRDGRGASAQSLDVANDVVSVQELSSCGAVARALQEDQRVVVGRLFSHAAVDAYEQLQMHRT